MDRTKNDPDGAKIYYSPMDNNHSQRLEAIELALSRCTCPPLELSVHHHTTPSIAEKGQPTDTLIILTLSGVDMDNYNKTGVITFVPPAPS